MDNLQLSITLPVQFVNIVLAALDEQPRKVVHAVYAAIQTQAQMQIAAAQAPKPPPEVPAAPRE